MARAKFQRTEEFAALEWCDTCLVARGLPLEWSNEATVSGGWSDDAREHVARRARHLERVGDDALPDEPHTAVEREFQALAEVWRQGTRGAPFVITRVTHWAYQRIIGMGPTALPLILRELDRQTDHWYWALNAITGEDPAEGVVNFEEAATRWREWGRRVGLLT